MYIASITPAKFADEHSSLNVYRRYTTLQLKNDGKGQNFMAGEVTDEMIGLLAYAGAYWTLYKNVWQAFPLYARTDEA